MRRIARTAEPRCRKTGTDTVGTPLAMPALRAFDHGNRKHPAPQLRGTTRPLRSLSRSHRYPVSVSGGIERLPGGNRRLETRIRLAGRSGTDLYLDLIGGKRHRFSPPTFARRSDPAIALAWALGSLVRAVHRFAQRGHRRDGRLLVALVRLSSFSSTDR